MWLHQAVGLALAGEDWLPISAWNGLGDTTPVVTICSFLKNPQENGVRDGISLSADFRGFFLCSEQCCSPSCQYLLLCSCSVERV